MTEREIRHPDINIVAYDIVQSASNVYGFGMTSIEYDLLESFAQQSVRFDNIDPRYFARIGATVRRATRQTDMLSPEATRKLENIFIVEQPSDLLEMIDTSNIEETIQILSDLADRPDRDEIEDEQRDSLHKILYGTVLDSITTTDIDKPRLEAYRVERLLSITDH